MNKKGFTLVEMLLVIVIMGIITALTMPGFIQAISESETRKEEHLTTLIKQELDMLNKDVGEYDFWYDGNSEIETCTIEGTTQDDNCIAIIKTDANGVVSEHSIYAKKIKQDIEVDNCTITNVYIYKQGKHKVEIDCTN